MPTKLTHDGIEFADGTKLQSDPVANFSDSRNWTISSGSQSGFGMGDTFSQNGDGNSVIQDTDPNGSRSRVWRSYNNDTSSDADGGWNQTLYGIDPNKSYMSIVFVKRASSSTNGSFYHGCSGASTLNLSGSSNTNPYFKNFNIGTLPLNVWCCSIGIINANNDSSTANSTLGGLYRLDTGAKVTSYTTFKMKSGVTTQIHRTYLYYSTSPATDIRWWNPGFYEINAGAPTLNQLVPKAGMDAGGGGGVTTKVYNSSTTWNKPSGCKAVEVTVTGGGGGTGRGYGYSYGVTTGGGLGGRGGHATDVINVENINSVSVTVGGGGNAYNGYSYNGRGGTGGASSFGNYVSATGGTGGYGGINRMGPDGTDGTASGALNNCNTGSGGLWQAGKRDRLTANNNNQNAQNGLVYGGGALGSYLGPNINGNKGGASGAAGVVFIKEYY